MSEAVFWRMEAGRHSTLTAAEFEAGYAARSGVTVAELHRCGLYPERCDCGAPDCRGWKMGHPWEDAIVEDEMRRTRGPRG